MKAKLILKHRGDYNYFLVSRTDNSEALVASLNPDEEIFEQKLSKQNCDEIFGIVNVEELAQEVCDDTISSPYHCYIAGFNKNAELNKDKVFTKQDMFDLYAHIVKNGIISGVEANEYIQSLQQPTEIEVEIVTEKVVDETKVIGGVKGVKGSGHKITTYKSIPKLDSSGNLILKKI
jgi:hypothetical protein